MDLKICQFRAIQSRISQPHPTIKKHSLIYFFPIHPQVYLFVKRRARLLARSRTRAGVSKLGEVRRNARESFRIWLCLSPLRFAAFCGSLLGSCPRLQHAISVLIAIYDRPFIRIGIVLLFALSPRYLLLDFYLL